MKPKVIIGVSAIVVFTSLLMYNFGNSISTYVNFEQASSQSGAHVVGIWDDTQEYGFSRDTMQFSFFMEDQEGNIRKVIYPRPKPNNFEQATQLVVIGEMRNDTFYASEMLMKCPSKYNDADDAQFVNAEEA